MEWYSVSMDVERTIEFLLESHAKHDAQIGAILAGQAKHDAQISAILAAQAKHEAQVAAMDKRLTKRLDGVTTLIKQGMKMLVKLAEAQKELTVEQREFRRQFRTFIAAAKNGRNGKAPNGH